MSGNKPSPIPGDRSRVTRIALISAIVVLAVAVVAMLGWAIFRPRPKLLAPRTYTPAEETSAGATTPTTRTAETTASPSAEESPAAPATPGVSAPADRPQGAVRAARIAFRLGAAIQVADEDGGSLHPVVNSADGVYALSPDGAALAIARPGNVSIYDVASGRVLFSALGEAVTPVWLPDSSAVLFVRMDADKAPQVYRVARTRGREAHVGAGAGAAVSPDGSTVVLVPAAGSTSSRQVLVSRGGGSFETVAVGGGEPRAVVLANDRMFVSTVSASDGSAIWSLALDGSDARKLVTPSSSVEKDATFGRMYLSPDGTALLYAAVGDDGYSRMFAVPTKGGAQTALSSGRDDYPLGWSASGRDILYIEGNGFQGEATALFHASPKGGRRLMVVSGAGL